MAKSRKSLNPVGTRDSILNAATGLFSEDGFHATSISDVASKAGVTKSLVQYHFGSKEDLWQAVIVSQVGPLIEALDAMLQTHQGNLGEVMRLRFKLLSERPALARLMAWAAMDPGLLPMFASEKVRQVMAIESWAQEPRSMDQGVDLFAAVFGFAAMDGFFQFRQVYSRLLCLDLSTSEQEERFQQMLNRVLSTKEVETP